jgi:hypothetical protein
MTMANVALFPSGETPKYYPSVNTSDYEGNADAVTNFDAGDPFSAVDRAIVLVALDEVNTLRTWTRSLKTETAAASTLADFKTRVATLATLGDRTAAQARTALLAHIDAGDAD